MEQRARIVLVRHGESEANVLGVFSNRGAQHPLTERGTAQAEALADRLAREGGADRIRTSPVLRARQTAAIVGERLGVTVEVDERLREFDVGTFEGSRDDAHWAEYDDVVTAWLERDDEDRRVGGGESHRELCARLADVVREVAVLRGTTVLVGHGGLFACGLPFVLDGVPVAWAQHHPLTPASLVEAEVRGDRIVCVGWADAVPGSGPGGR